MQSLKGRHAMKRLRLILAAMAGTTFLAAVGAASPADAGSSKTYFFGPYVLVGDWGPCVGADGDVAVFANTAPTSTFTVTSNGDGTYDVIRRDRNARFVSTGLGPSFSACDHGGASTLAAGVTGHFSGFLHVTAPGPFDPRGCDGGG
jgi:hypothetical protein